MSYATLCKLDGIDWRRHNLLSLAGVYQPKKKIEESKLPVALTRFLEDHPHVKTIYLHLDNDTARQAGGQGDHGCHAGGLPGGEQTPRPVERM